MDTLLHNMLAQVFALLLPFKLYFITLVCLVIFVKVVKSSWFKGKFGEWLINRYLTKKLNCSQYHLIKDVTLQTLDGTTQIDHLLVSKYGLFVIETKNMTGWIFGSAKQKSWTQKIYRYTGKFQNPLHQNYKHTQTLIEKLNLDKAHVFSVIVFVGDCEFKTPMPENVTYPRGMLEYIQSKQQTLMSEQEMILLRDTLIAIIKKPGLKTDREHVEHLKQKHNKV